MACARISELLPECIYGPEQGGKVLIAVFPESDDKATALTREKDKIESLFGEMGYEAYNWDSELKRMRKKKFLEEIKTAAQKLKDKERLAVVIICPQKDGKLRMSSGDTFDMEDVYLIFKGEQCPAMRCELKLVIFHTHQYSVPSPKRKHQDARASGITIRIPAVSKLPVTVPSEGYMFIIYSFEDYMNEDASPNESDFIKALTEVLEEDLLRTQGHREILELMIDVSSNVLQRKAENQIPIILSTLNSNCYLKRDIS